MSLEIAMLLGLLQGLTEFFPVSSSGHLALFGHWFGLGRADLVFDILVHLATLAAIIIYFRQDWRQLWRLVRHGEQGEFPKHILGYLVLATLPAVAVGWWLKDFVAGFHERPVWVGICLLGMGVLLLVGFFVRGQPKSWSGMNMTIALAMGLVQAAAILPGISRSGITIMVAVCLGLERHVAARFSFLMAVPVIAGAGLVGVLELIAQSANMGPELWLAYGAGFAASLISGFFALRYLMMLLKGGRFYLFGWYCLAMGVIAVVV